MTRRSSTPRVRSAIGNGARLLRTVRHLQMGQVTGRLSAKTRRVKVDQSPAPQTRVRCADWVLPVSRERRLFEPTKLAVVGELCDLETHGWDHASLSRLARYNMHYFEDLVAADAPQRRDAQAALIERWISENPPVLGTGWEPYPTSLRIVNWIKWAWSGGHLSQQAVDSLAMQARVLVQQVEWHLRGNHLLANAKALVFAGLFFEGAEAEAWLSEGLEILTEELPEQVLPDGGHFELSPMYHALATEDLLDLINIAAGVEGNAQLSQQLQEWRHFVPSMLRWLACLSHPDGDIAFFNDSALGVAPSLAELVEYSGRVGISADLPTDDGVVGLWNSGYVRLRLASALLIADVAAIGPDYLPAHGHADTLSFELSLGSQRVIVNGGTSLYEASAERQRQRSTAAHSTVTVAGADSSEVWGSFRVGRRAKPRPVALEVGRQSMTLSADHDGYRHLPGRFVHHRAWELAPGRLIVLDSIDGRGDAEFVVRFHLHPSLHPVEDRGAVRVLEQERHVLSVSTACPSDVRVEKSTWHPRFGTALDSYTLVVRTTTRASSEVAVTFEWDET